MNWLVKDFSWLILIRLILFDRSIVESRVPNSLKTNDAIKYDAKISSNEWKEKLNYLIAVLYFA